MAARLKEYYKNTVFSGLMDKFQYKNAMEVPKLEKITLNMGLGNIKDNQKMLETAVQELAVISGQKPVMTRAKKSIANFKLREGMPIGAKVTLRGENMYIFADKFFNIALPRVRDFKGVSRNSFDGRGNYTMGIRSSSSSLKSITTRSTRSRVWISRLRLRRRPTKKRRHFWKCSACRLKDSRGGERWLRHLSR